MVDFTVECLHYQMTKPDTFYIVTLSYPSDGVITSISSLPIMSGDVVVFLGPDGDSKPLEWKWTQERTFKLWFDLALLDGVDNDWAFKVIYT